VVRSAFAVAGRPGTRSPRRPQTAAETARATASTLGATGSPATGCAPDHCGGNRFFAHATFLCQTGELRGAHWPEPFARENYERSDFDLPVAWRELDGAYDVIGDETVTLLLTPGHTARHQSLVLRWQQRTVVLERLEAATHGPRSRRRPSAG
jgi:hypothetical protein